MTFSPTCFLASSILAQNYKKFTVFFQITVSREVNYRCDDSIKLVKYHYSDYTTLHTEKKKLERRTITRQFIINADEVSITKKRIGNIGGALPAKTAKQRYISLRDM